MMVWNEQSKSSMIVKGTKNTWLKWMSKFCDFEEELQKSYHETRNQNKYQPPQLQNNLNKYM